MFFSPLFCFSSSGTAALEEDAQILKVIEAYCTSAKTRQTLNSSKTTRKLTDTAHVHAQQTRGAHWSSPSLLLLYSVTQCLSLTLVFWSDLSNSIFSFCLSLLHSSPFWHRFLTFFLIFPLIDFSFPPCCFIIFLPCSGSAHHPHLAVFLWFPIRCLCYLLLLLLLHHPHFPPTTFASPPQPAWQGTDLMHNHVLADVDRSCMDSPGRRSSVSRPELSSDLSEDSDYDSIWTTHSYRMGSVPRKSCISHQN